MDKWGKCKVIIKWILKIAVAVLRSPFASFDLDIPELISFISEKTQDGKLTDKDAADILERIENTL